MSNLLVALKNIICSHAIDVTSKTSGNNRANSMGEAFEEYVKDMFCNTLGKTGIEKYKEYAQHFSYLGNQNNPPDIMLRGGDAIEVKKIEGVNNTIPLNSSYPKKRVYSNDPMITKTCRNCEEWSEKDLIYVVGTIPKGKLKSLWIVHGDTYCADREIYERAKTVISEGINSLPGIQFSETKELGRVNGVDPLGITQLRIRGMWGITNPAKCFNYLDINSEKECELVVNTIVLADKYNSFPEQDKYELENMNEKGLTISKVQILSPNNPVELLDAYHIKYLR